MSKRVKSKRTGKLGFATEITSTKGSTWQVVDETGNDIYYFAPEEFANRFVIMGSAKAPIPDWMKPDPKQKPQQGSLFN
jgi:hypothetical protein